MEASKRQITYVGPKDEREVTTIYRLPGGDGDDLVLAVGVPKDATEAQIKALKKDKDHKFTVGETEAGDDAGAPWDDYSTLNADEVIERIHDPAVTASAADAQAVADYEKAHDKRKTVVEAAEHQAEAYDPQGEGSS